MYSGPCKQRFDQLEHKSICFSTKSCLVFQGKKAIDTIEKACKARARLASTFALDITKRIIDIMLNLFP